ncbi:unnamed protein product [Laminaria digitata]
MILLLVTLNVMPLPPVSMSRFLVPSKYSRQQSSSSSSHGTSRLCRQYYRCWSCVLACFWALVLCSVNTHPRHVERHAIVSSSVIHIIIDRFLGAPTFCRQ